MSVVISNLSFAYGDRPLLSNISLVLSARRTGIIGRNGSGKTTLLRLIVGELSPMQGRVTAPSAARLSQDLLQHGDTTVAELLGVAEPLAALRRIEAGSVDAADYELVSGRWDLESRANALLAARVPSLTSPGALERASETLSGGELIQVAMAGLELADARLALLDEPTNNLDRAARAALLDVVRAWRGQLILVSHDTELLDQMDEIVELHDAGAEVFGGNYTAFLFNRRLRDAAAERDVREASAKLRAERRNMNHMATATARATRQSSARFGPGKSHPSDPTEKRAALARRANRVAASARKVREAREQLAEAESRLRSDDAIRIPMIDLARAKGRRLAELVTADQRIPILGGDRVGITGAIGSGKSTMLRLARDTATGRVGYLDQRLTLPSATVFDAVHGSSPRPPQDTHALLARFLLRGPMLSRPVNTLSGGERFRVALATILLADPPPELLILDEPTNNLDRESVAQLTQALLVYPGAIVVVSHDEHFLAELDLHQAWHLEAGRLHESPPPASTGSSAD